MYYIIFQYNKKLSGGINALAVFLRYGNIYLFFDVNGVKNIKFTQRHLFRNMHIHVYIIETIFKLS